MRRLQSRVQRLCVSARGQKAAAAKEVGDDVKLHHKTPIAVLPGAPFHSCSAFDRSVSKLISSIFLAVLFCVGGFISASGQITFGGPDERFINDIDRIHQGDVIEVDVVGSFEFDWRGSLNPEGFIDGIERLPEPVFARCKSTAQIANSIAEGLRKILRDPVVEVRIIDRNGRTLSYIEGAVKTPLRLLIKRDVYLQELIVLAGGFTDVIGDDISVFRPVGVSCEGARDGALPDGPVTRVVKIRDLLAGSGESNLKIVAGEVVTVVESLPIYVIGGVGSPQRLSARAGITLSRAIDTAGGIAKKGRENRVTVYRRKGSDPQVFEIDLEKVRSGEAEDLPLEANDIVEVPLKGEEKRVFPPLIELRELDRKRIPLRIIE